MRAAITQIQPLDFLKLLAHDIRWQILLALSQSDRRVEELVKKLKQPHNLVSYHLKRLRLKRLVRERRSSADGRDIYYSLNFDQFRELYFQTGQSLHPAFSDVSPQPNVTANSTRKIPARILFLCTHNSARSQIAEGLLRAVGGDRVEVFSAGSEPTSIHPLAVKVMSGRGIDLTKHHSKHLREFLGQDFDYVITVCDRVRESCPVFPGDPEQIHWSFPDPAAVKGDLETQERAFEETAREMTNRIQYLLLLIDRAQKS